MEHKIQEISWRDALPIRHRVLWPQRDAEFCSVPGDEEALHFGVFVESELVTVASVFIDGACARLRKFATLPAYQGRGLGSSLIAKILARLSVESIEVFWCDARETAVDFYQRFGMQPEGERFYKENIAYFKMSIPIISANNK